MFAKTIIALAVEHAFPGGPEMGLPSFHMAMSVLEPIFCILQQCETGYVDSINGEPVFLDWEGEWLEIDSALRGFCDCFARIAEGERMELDLEPVRKLGKKLKYGVPFDVSDVERAKAVVTRCASIYLATPVQRIRRYIDTEAIAIEFAAKGITA